MTNIFRHNRTRDEVAFDGSLDQAGAVPDRPIDDLDDFAFDELRVDPTLRWIHSGDYGDRYESAVEHVAPTYIFRLGSNS